MQGKFIENNKVIEVGVPKSWASTACTAKLNWPFLQKYRSNNLVNLWKALT